MSMGKKKIAALTMALSLLGVLAVPFLMQPAAQTADIGYLAADAICDNFGCGGTEGLAKAVYTGVGGYMGAQIGAEIGGSIGWLGGPGGAIIGVAVGAA